MSGPDFIICLECESPCYTFEWEHDKIVEPLCRTCGNEEPEQFLTEEDLEALGDDPRS